MGVRVAKGSLRGSREYSNQLIPPAAEGHEGAQGRPHGLQLEHQEGGRRGHSPDAVAGFPQNGSKTPLPRPAARTPSPTPAPTRRKLQSSEPGNCQLGGWGAAGAADQCVTAGAETRRVPGDHRESRAGHAGPRRPGWTLVAHPLPPAAAAQVRPRSPRREAPGCLTAHTRTTLSTSVGAAPPQAARETRAGTALSPRPSAPPAPTRPASRGTEDAPLT